MRTDECVELFNFCLFFGCFSEDKTFDFEKRGRRNSDSAVYLKANEEPPILRPQRDEAELRQKIIGLEQKINRMRIGTFLEDPVARLIKEDIRSVSSQSELAFNGIHCFSIYMTLTASRVRSLKSVRPKFPHEGRT